MTNQDPTWVKLPEEARGTFINKMLVAICIDGQRRRAEVAIEALNEPSFRQKWHFPQDDRVIKGVMVIAMGMPCQGGGLDQVVANAIIMLFIAFRSRLASFADVRHLAGTTRPGVNFTTSNRGEEFGLLQKVVT